MSGKGNKINTAPPRGMRDHLPDELSPRLKVVESLRRTFELYGFQPLETPAMERLEVLEGKSGEEADKLTYRVMKRGEELQRSFESLVKSNCNPPEIVSSLSDMGMRYEFTVSLARVYAQYQSRLTMPFKRYQVGPVWRADRPQKGRYREFVQCDVDIVGSDSVMADAELISLAVDALTELNMPAFDVQINNRMLLNILSLACGNEPEQYRDFCVALDKLDKIGVDGVEREMKERGLSSARLNLLWNLADNRHKSDRELLKGVKEFVKEIPEGCETVELVGKLLDTLNLLGVPSEKVRFNPTLARGLDYYTGTVFEAVLKDGGSGSLLGGGRYDELIGVFSGRPVPAVGFSFGLDRLVDVLIEAGALQSTAFSVDVSVLDLVGSEESTKYCGWIVRKLREKGIASEIFHKQGVKPGKGLQTLNKRDVPFAVLTGTGELKTVNGGDPSEFRLTVKHLASGEQRDVAINEAIRWIQNNS